MSIVGGGIDVSMTIGTVEITGRILRKEMFNRTFFTMIHILKIGRKEGPEDEKDQISQKNGDRSDRSNPTDGNSYQREESEAAQHEESFSVPHQTKPQMFKLFSPGKATR
jgi:hypothetical protein